MRVNMLGIRPSSAVVTRRRQVTGNTGRSGVLRCYYERNVNKHNSCCLMTTNQSWIKVFGVHSFGGPSQSHSSRILIATLRQYSCLLLQQQPHFGNDHSEFITLKHLNVLHFVLRLLHFITYCLLFSFNAACALHKCY